MASLAIGDPVRTRQVDRCGHKQVPLIVGGTPAKPREFPHMALIGYAALSGKEWNCGGSLISERWVVTAGHCSQTRLGPAKFVRLGEFDRTKTTDDARPEDFTVVQNIPHPDYLTNSTYNDIALLQLDRTATLSPYIRPICLPQTKEIKEKRAVASGWGLIEYQGEKSDLLLKVTLELFPSNECNTVYGKELKWKNGLNETQQICAGSRSSIEDTCEGDSGKITSDPSLYHIKNNFVYIILGGPIQVYHPNQYCMYTIIGITSFGKSCGLAGTPGVYTRLHTYVPWIEKIIWP